MSKHNKKRKKKEDKEQNKKPKLDEEYYKIFGQDVQPSLVLNLKNILKGTKTHLMLRDIQELILWMYGEGPTPLWISIFVSFFKFNKFLE